MANLFILFSIRVFLISLLDRNELDRRQLLISSVLFHEYTSDVSPPWALSIVVRVGLHLQLISDVVEIYFLISVNRILIRSPMISHEKLFSSTFLFRDLEYERLLTRCLEEDESDLNIA